MGRYAVPIFLSIVAAGGAVSWAQDPAPSLLRLLNARDKESKREDVRHTEALESTMDRMVRAFERGDEKGLEKFLVPGRVYLSLKARGEEAGYYGHSQIKFMFAKLFRERKTESFGYDREDIDSSGGTALVRAEWRYMVLEEDQMVTEHLRFKLERSGNDWRISEIRSQTR